MANPGDPQLPKPVTKPVTELAAELYDTFPNYEGCEERLLRAILHVSIKQLAVLEEILAALKPPTPPPDLPVAATLTFSNKIKSWFQSPRQPQPQGEPSMAVRKATMDFQLVDSTTATGTLGFVDAAGLATTLPAGATLSGVTYTPSGPQLVATPSADLLSVTITPSSPPQLATDVTIAVSAFTINLANGTTISIPGFTSEGIDIIGGGPAGAQLSIS
jgi:hypothetical protein